MATKRYFPSPVTQNWVEKVGRDWQKRLRLDEWLISFKVVTKKDADKNYGFNASITRRKVAHIYILDKDAYETGDLVGYDPEVTIVHELLHCHLNTLRTEAALINQTEFAIEAISHALVAAKRGKAKVDMFVRTLTSPRELAETK